MYQNHTICVVIPAFNEEHQIGSVVRSMPAYVDCIVVIDDKSTDGTAAVVQNLAETEQRVILIAHEENQGCGGALASGYQYAIEKGYDVAVRMDGDGQMLPEYLPALLKPIVENRADYTKGNRLFTGEAFKRIPKVRYFGNAFLSLLTKIASGYWHIADFQSGYTAICKKALHTIEWHRMYKRYGQPNDLLVRLNVYNYRVMDIPVEPLYNVGEKSGMKIWKVMFTLSWLLIKLFFWRMKEKYIIRDFHPLIFFYTLGGVFGISTVVLLLRVIFYKVSVGYFPPTSSLALMFAFMSMSLFLLFAMWFDMEANKDLKGMPDLSGIVLDCRDPSTALAFSRETGATTSSNRTHVETRSS